MFTEDPARIPVHLRDVAPVIEDATDIPSGYALVNGQRAVYILVTKRADASTLDVVKRVSVMAERSNPLRLRFADGELTASMQAPDVGEARETVPLEFAGDPLEIGFNPGFLREGIESVDSDEILLRLISPLRPAVLMGAEDDYTYLIMPIRLPG